MTTEQDARGARAASGTGRATGSVIVPAHNEASVIERCLVPLSTLDPGEVDVVVVANGCSDSTAEVARRVAPSATVVEIDQASKPAALRTGERHAKRLPRLFIDGDVEVTARAVQDTLAALNGGAVAARPPFVYDAAAATWLVRSYYRARTAMPSLHKHAWGAGVYGLSEAARNRFGEFPDLVGDDLWVDRLLAPGELEVVDTDPVRVSTPRDAPSLLRVLRRAQRAKGEAAGPEAPRNPPTEFSAARDLRAVVGRGATGPFDALVYSCFALTARALARRRTTGWERDDSSREAVDA